MVKTRVCLISDTHTSTLLPASFKNYAFRNPLPKADVLIHAGDLTKVGYLKEHETTVSMLKEADAELKLVIAGNHDLTLDEEYYTSYGYRRHRKPIRLGITETGTTANIGDDAEYMARIMQGDVPPLEEMKDYVRRAKDLWTNQSARDAGIRYLDEGVHSFALSNGAKITVYASPYQPEFCRWAFAYPRSEDRYNLPPPGSNAAPPQNPVPDHGIDIMLTHGPPKGILDLVGGGEEVGCAHLLRAADRARPQLYAFGHIHEGWGATRGTWGISPGGGVITKESIKPDPEDMLENRGAFYDMSSESDRPWKCGAETLFVNASICTLSYEPKNAPWVVDLDLKSQSEMGFSS